MSEARELLEGLNFTVIDLETTGGNHQKDQIIEIGMTKISKLQITGECCYLLDPERKIPEFIQRLTSISQKDTVGMPKINDVIDEVLEFIGDDILVAHNTSFDIPFLNSVLRRLGRDELKNKVICTNVMTKHMIPEILSSNLHYMSQLFKIGHDQVHRAKDDAMASAELLLKYLSIFEEKGIKKVNQLYYPKNKFELDRINFLKTDSLDLITEKISKFHYPMSLSFKGEKGIILACLPLENPSAELKTALKFINELSWEMLTIKLHGSFVEALFEYNSHFNKYTAMAKELSLNYLQQRYLKQKHYPVEEIDFILTHHLVSQQVICYSFLHLNPSSRHIFKIPSHRKKLFQFISKSIKGHRQAKLEKNIKLLHAELLPILKSYLSEHWQQEQFLNLKISDFEKGPDHIFQLIEDYANKRDQSIDFPPVHL